MALAARDIALTRETFAQWLSEYEGKADRAELRSYIEGKLVDHSLDDVEVDTSQRTDLAPDAVALIDLIMDDLPSYDGYHKIFG